MASDNEASCESDPNFAVICAFMEKFGAMCGLADVDFLELQEMLENTQEVSQELIALHIKLLRKMRKSVSNERWERSLIRFCHGFSVQDAWEIERFGYKKSRLSSKLRVLKELLEVQFDLNAKFKMEINKMSAEELRSQPLGKDKLGHAYWFQSDNNCQIRVYKEDPDEETWTLVARDREGLVGLISELSGGDSAFGSEAVINEEDSNSLAEKPIIDTGQGDSNSSQSSAKKASDDSESSNDLLEPKTEEEAKIPDDLRKRPRESDEGQDLTIKKPKLDDDVSGEVTATIEEPVMLIEGSGAGEDNNAANPIVGEEIEEPVMFVYGNGAGSACQTGNKDEGNRSDKNTQNLGDKSKSDSISRSGDPKNRGVSNNNDGTDDESCSKSPVKTPFKLGTIIDTKKTDNKVTRTNPIKKSRWDVVDTVDTNKSPEGPSTSQVDQPPEQVKSSTPAKFFFGPRCVGFKPAPSVGFGSAAIVGFGDKVPQTQSKTNENTTDTVDDDVTAPTRNDPKLQIGSESIETKPITERKQSIVDYQDTSDSDDDKSEVKLETGGEQGSPVQSVGPESCLVHDLTRLREERQHLIGTKPPIPDKEIVQQIEDQVVDIGDESSCAQTESDREGDRTVATSEPKCIKKFAYTLGDDASHDTTSHTTLPSSDLVPDDDSNTKISLDDDQQSHTVAVTATESKAIDREPCETNLGPEPVQFNVEAISNTIEQIPNSGTESDTKIESTESVTNIPIDEQPVDPKTSQLPELVTDDGGMEEKQSTIIAAPAESGNISRRKETITDEVDNRTDSDRTIIAKQVRESAITNPDGSGLDSSTGEQIKIAPEETSHSTDVTVDKPDSDVELNKPKTVTAVSEPNELKVKNLDDSEVDQQSGASPKAEKPPEDDILKVETKTDLKTINAEPCSIVKVNVDQTEVDVALVVIGNEQRPLSETTPTKHSLDPSSGNDKNAGDVLSPTRCAQSGTDGQALKIDTTIGPNPDSLSNPEKLSFPKSASNSVKSLDSVQVASNLQKPTLSPGTSSASNKSLLADAASNALEPLLSPCKSTSNLKNKSDTSSNPDKALPPEAVPNPSESSLNSDKVASDPSRNLDTSSNPQEPTSNPDEKSDASSNPDKSLSAETASLLDSDKVALNPFRNLDTSSKSQEVISDSNERADTSSNLENYLAAEVASNPNTPSLDSDKVTSNPFRNPGTTSNPQESSGPSKKPSNPDEQLPIDVTSNPDKSLSAEAASNPNAPSLDSGKVALNPSRNPGGTSNPQEATSIPDTSSDPNKSTNLASNPLEALLGSDHKKSSKPDEPLPTEAAPKSSSDTSSDTYKSLSTNVASNPVDALDSGSRASNPDEPLPADATSSSDTSSVSNKSFSTNLASNPPEALLGSDKRATKPHKKSSDPDEQLPADATSNPDKSPSVEAAPKSSSDTSSGTYKSLSTNVASNPVESLLGSGKKAPNPHKKSSNTDEPLAADAASSSDTSSDSNKSLSSDAASNPVKALDSVKIASNPRKKSATSSNLDKSLSAEAVPNPNASSLDSDKVTSNPFRNPETSSDPQETTLRPDTSSDPNKSSTNLASNPLGVLLGSGKRSSYPPKKSSNPDEPLPADATLNPDKSPSVEAAPKSSSDMSSGTHKLLSTNVASKPVEALLGSGKRAPNPHKKSPNRDEPLPADATSSSDTSSDPNKLLSSDATSNPAKTLLGSGKRASNPRKKSSNPDEPLAANAASSSDTSSDLNRSLSSDAASNPVEVLLDSGKIASNPLKKSDTSSNLDKSLSAEAAPNPDASSLDSDKVTSNPVKNPETSSDPQETTLRPDMSSDANKSLLTDRASNPVKGLIDSGKIASTPRKKSDTSSNPVKSLSAEAAPNPNAAPKVASNPSSNLETSSDPNKSLSSDRASNAVKSSSDSGNRASNPHTSSNSDKPSSTDAALNLPGNPDTSSNPGKSSTSTVKTKTISQVAVKRNLRRKDPKEAGKPPAKDTVAPEPKTEAAPPEPNIGDLYVKIDSSLKDEADKKINVENKDLAKPTAVTATNNAAKRMGRPPGRKNNTPEVAEKKARVMGTRRTRATRSEPLSILPADDKQEAVPVAEKAPGQRRGRPKPSEPSAVDQPVQAEETPDKPAGQRRSRPKPPADKDDAETIDEPSELPPPPPPLLPLQDKSTPVRRGRSKPSEDEPSAADRPSEPQPVQVEETPDKPTGQRRGRPKPLEDKNDAETIDESSEPPASLPVQEKSTPVRRGRSKPSEDESSAADRPGEPQPVQVEETRDKPTGQRRGRPKSLEDKNEPEIIDEPNTITPPAPLPVQEKSTAVRRGRSKPSEDEPSAADRPSEPQPVQVEETRDKPTGPRRGRPKPPDGKDEPSAVDQPSEPLPVQAEETRDKPQGQRRGRPKPAEDRGESEIIDEPSDPPPLPVQERSSAVRRGRSKPSEDKDEPSAVDQPSEPLLVQAEETRDKPQGQRRGRPKPPDDKDEPEIIDEPSEPPPLPVQEKSMAVRRGRSKPSEDKDEPSAIDQPSEPPPIQVEETREKPTGQRRGRPKPPEDKDEPSSVDRPSEPPPVQAEETPNKPTGQRRGRSKPSDDKEQLAEQKDKQGTPEQPSELDETRKKPAQRRGRPKPNKATDKEEQEDDNKKIKLAASTNETEASSLRQTRSRKTNKETDAVKTVPDPEKSEPAKDDSDPDSPTSVAEDPAIMVDSSSNSCEVVESLDQDPLAVSDDDDEEQPSALMAGEKPMSLSSFSLDFRESPPPLIRRGRRKRGREVSPSANMEEMDAGAGKRIKMRGKRNVDAKLRKSIEEQKMELISSDDDGHDKQPADIEAETEAATTAAVEPPPVEDVPEKKPVGRKKRGRKGRQKPEAAPEQEPSPTDVAAAVEDNDKPEEEEGKAEANDAESTPPPTKKTKSKHKRLLKDLDITLGLPPKFDTALPIRQSRRIAQLKIKEQAERKRLEEEMRREQEQEKKKKYKKVEEKAKDVVDDDDDDDDVKDVEYKVKKPKKKKRRHVDPRELYDAANPWRSSSESSSSNDDEEGEDEEEDSDDAVLQFVSDHEFSPESDLEGDEEAQPLRRARTARKESDVEEVDDCPCQKCLKSDHPEWILLCDSCDNGWHCSCLRPPLLVIPEGDWFCPPCQHARLLHQLGQKLEDYDKRLNKKQMEDRRKERLAYVGISLNNVLPAKVKSLKRQSKDQNDDADVVEKEASSSDESESESDADSASDSDSDEPIYQLRQRRQAHSYRFNDYDDLINSAIQDEMDAVKGAGNQGRGKDISTIINAEKEEEEKRSDVPPLAEEGPEPLPPVVPVNTEPQPVNSDDEVIKPVKRMPGQRKKHRKLNALDISSEDDDEGSDEDFKGTNSESEDELDDDLESEDSDELDTRRGRRGRGADPVRRSTRARISRYDADFIDDGDSEDEAPRRKKKKSLWDDSESEESDCSWGRRKRKPAAARNQQRSAAASGGSKKKKTKKKKKKRDDDDSDVEVYRKKKPKIKFGLDDDDEGPGRRTRGKKINYVDALGSDSDEDRIKRPPPRIESEEEYVANEEEELDDDDKISEDEAESSEEAVNNKQQEDRGLNPIEQINKNLEEMDENEMEKMMEEEEYANKQLQLVALQIEKEKKRKEREAKKLETTVAPMETQFSAPLHEPIVGSVDSLIVNDNNDELSEPPGVSLPLFADLAISNDGLEETSPKKRRGRGRGKKSLEEAVANLGTVRQQEALQSSVPFMTGPPPPSNNNKGLETTNIEIAAPPQPFSQSQPAPSVITRMLQNKPPGGVGTAAYPVGTIRPKQFAAMPDRDNEVPPPPVSHHGMTAHHGGGAPPGQYMPGPGGMRPQMSSPYHQAPAPALNHYSRPGATGPPHQVRSPVPPQALPPHIYHSHRPLDPSPSGGGALNMSDHHGSPNRVASPATSSPGGKSDTPPPPYSRPPSTGRFPMNSPAAAAAAPPPSRHNIHMVAAAPPPPHMQQPRPNMPPYHPGMAGYHYGSYPQPPPMGQAEDAMPLTVYQNSPYNDQFSNEGQPVNHSENSNGKSFEEESGGEFGGLVSYFSSQREDDLES